MINNIQTINEADILKSNDEEGKEQAVSTGNAKK
jgi:hypothetical protein